jgi:hypothetical protein
MWMIRLRGRNLFVAGLLGQGASCAVYEGPGGTADAGSSMQPSYDAAQVCIDLLAANTPWDCPETPPEIPDDPGDVLCLRDTYVLAAVTYCWAAECRGREDRLDEAHSFEQSALDELMNADDLCSCATPIAEDVTCYTEPFYPCPSCP